MSLNDQSSPSPEAPELTVNQQKESSVEFVGLELLHPEYQDGYKFGLTMGRSQGHREAAKILAQRGMYLLAGEILNLR